MSCKFYKYKISIASNNDRDPDDATMRHIAQCVHCRAYYHKLRQMTTLLGQVPDTGLENYDFDALNSRISDRLDKAVAGSEVNLPTRNQRFSRHLAMAASLLITVALGISVFSNINNSHSSGGFVSTLAALYQRISDPALWSMAHSEPSSNSTTGNNIQLVQQTANTINVSSPQMFLLCQLSTLPYGKLASLPYQEEYQRSKEMYSKASEVTGKSAEILTALTQSSVYLFRPF